MNNLTIASIIDTNAQTQPEAIAIKNVEDESITYLQLHQQIEDTVKSLNNYGIGINDPAAIVLSNGPLMAVAFLSVASGAVSAPLNPTYTASEYRFYLDDLKAKAVIIEEGWDNPVIDIAHELNIPILTLQSKGDLPYGLFKITTSVPSSSTSKPGMAKMSDLALILHTSGTISRPKMVPLTQKNLCTSAGNIRGTLKLTPQDRCLNIMPLFHIHGLMAAVMATMLAGGSIVCTPGFYAPEFYKWLEAFHPTWYSAVPTMHQAILYRSKNNLEVINRSNLRFIRSSSSSLAPNVMAELESTFGVPVIEAYGMTEASHQMACNPLPPGIRKPGSVGLPAGPEVAVMAEDKSELLPPGTMGEVVIRGDNVTLGYMNNKEANAKAFTDGWFRTGDQGYLDTDGYLFLTGRLKEIINRGGEKISPREVDEVILQHPGVTQVLTFSIPDKVLGEDIAAAVVLKDKTLTDKEIKYFAAKTLAPHKVPSKIVILDEIPKGPTGKLQRIGLAEKLGLDDGLEKVSPKNIPYSAPKTQIEGKICQIWQEVLDLDRVGINSRFTDIGGDSMLATLIQVKLESVFGINISLIEISETPTVYEQAVLVEKILNKES